MRYALLMLALVRFAAADTARDLAWQQDLDTLSTQLPRLHPNLFFQVNRSEWTGAVAQLRGLIPQLTDVQVMAGLARVTAMVRDGHTNLFLTQRNSTFHLLPLQMRWFEDGLFITGAGPGYPRALGARVVQIGDVPLDQTYMLIGGIISHENDSWVREISPLYLVDADLLQGLGITASNVSVPFVLEDRNGRFTLDIASLAPGTTATSTLQPDPNTGFTPFWRQHTDRNYWFTYVPSSKLLYFAYNVCREQNDLSFALFNDLLWQTFDTNPVETFVLDLRNNTGGNSSIINPFVASGMARLDRLVGVRTAVIIGRRTFSAAITDAIGFKQGPVYLVGEPSGGSPNSYGEVLSFVLPNSNLTVSYSTKHFSFPGYPDGPLMPDVPVRSYSVDYFSRHDPFLAAVLARTDPGTTFRGTAVFNAAAPRLDQPVAPGSLATAFPDLGNVAAADASALPLPELLGGVAVAVNGKPAPLLTVRPGQINFQIPPATDPGIATVSIRRGGSGVASYSAWISGSAPGIFAVTGSGPVLTIWATGQGVAQAAPRVYFGADLAEVLYSGESSYPGLWQINVRVPQNASGENPVFVGMGGNASNGALSRLF
jgi:hypothetical protein